VDTTIADADCARISGDIILFSGRMVAENDCPVKMTAENDCPESFRREGDSSE